MSEEPSRPKLTGDQIILLYERQVNRATVWVVLGGFAAVIVAIAFLFFIETQWLAWTLLAVCILAGGMLQRLLVLRVRCPACGARVLGRIHSIVQVRGIKTCPYCKTKLRR